MKHLLAFLFAASLWGQTSGVVTSGNIRSGTGSPEGVVSAPVGTQYQRTDGSTGTTLYIKESGAGNTGWTAVSSGGAGAASTHTDFALTRNSGTLATLAAGRYQKGTGTLWNLAQSTFSITTLSITSCTNASPIVCTVSDMTGTSIANGHQVTISGVSTNTNANGTFNVEKLTQTTIALLGSTGNGAGTGGTVAGAGSGTCVVYGAASGYATLDCPASAALITTCTGPCSMRQSTSSAVPSDGTPFGELTVVSGAFTAAADTRGWLNSGKDVQAGQGIAVADAGGTATVSVDSTVARTSGTNNYTGSNNFSAATRTVPHRTGTGSPVARDNCSTVGETYYQTDASAGSNTWGCTATGTPGTWALQGGSSSSLVVYRLPFMTVQEPGGGGRWTGLWHSTNPLSLVTVNASAGTCPTTSALAECGNAWYSLSDASQSYRTTEIWIPTGWTSGTVKFFLTFATSTSADPAFQVKARCMTSGSAPSTYNGTQNLPSGTVATGNTYTRSVTLDTTGCAANRPMTISLTRTDTADSGGYAIMLDAFVEVQVQ